MDLPFTAQAFDDFLKFNNIDSDVKFVNNDDDENNLLHLTEFGKDLREKINKGRFPLNMKTEILEAFDSLNSEVAVRSSSTAEDMPDASFAGQQDTFLNIKPIPNG